MWSNRDVRLGPIQPTLGIDRHREVGLGQQRRQARHGGGERGEEALLVRALKACLRIFASARPAS